MYVCVAAQVRVAAHLRSHGGKESEAKEPEKAARKCDACVRLVPWSARKPLACLHIHSARGIRTASLIDTRSKRQTHRAPASPRRQGAESRRAAEPIAHSP